MSSSPLHPTPPVGPSTPAREALRRTPGLVKGQPCVATLRPGTNTALILDLVLRADPDRPEGPLVRAEGARDRGRPPANRLERGGAVVALVQQRGARGGARADSLEEPVGSPVAQRGARVLRVRLRSGDREHLDNGETPRDARIAPIGARGRAEEGSARAWRGRRGGGWRELLPRRHSRQRHRHDDERKHHQPSPDAQPADEWHAGPGDADADRRKPPTG